MKISRCRKHQERSKEKTQIPRRRKHQEQPNEKTQIPRRRNYQKYFKGKNPENRKTVERSGDVKVNKSRPRLLITYITLDSSRERAGYVNLQAPRTSYGPR